VTHFACHYSVFCPVTNSRHVFFITPALLPLSDVNTRPTHALSPQQSQITFHNYEAAAF
jgi:hypothetical protein